MANVALRLSGNSPGDFYVDSTCIDCDTCRQIAPSIFREAGDMSVVFHQPQDDAELKSALMALVACPTGSIGATETHGARIGIEAFPSLIEQDVYFCGFTAESSFGAWSYLIVRPESRGGNVLVDSPRFNAQLAARIEAMGGARTMLLTHKDDIADHERFARRFSCERVMHADDGAARLGMERTFRDGNPIAIDSELVAIPVPGHTKGHMVFLYRNEILFTGDHLAWSPNRNTLIAFRNACWYSWKEQIASMEKLLHYTFTWVLPGHGRIHHDTPAGMKTHLECCIEWMKRAA